MRSLVLVAILMLLPGLSQAADDINWTYYNHGPQTLYSFLTEEANYMWDEELESLQRAAERALETPPLTVVDKEVLPASGDPHDYLSYAPYWWPDPDKEDGLPWIRRDGERSPQSEAMPNRSDRARLFGAVRDLAWAYYYLGDEEYAQHAAMLLRTWFIEPETRMNPNLNHAQAIPGRRDGSGIGIIDWAQTPALLDQIRIIETSPVWTEDDRTGIRKWFSEFSDWLLTSEHGRYEAGMHNNHGTYYDCLVIAISLFLDDRELAREICEAAGDKRIAPQLAPDGSQPLELQRTKSWDYSIYNLQAMVLLARLATEVGVDLWNYTDDEGAGIEQAIAFLLPYALGEQEWKWKQIKEIHYNAYASLLSEAGIIYEDRDAWIHHAAEIREIHGIERGHSMFYQW